MNDQVKQRILSYSTPPPADAWNGISSFLNDEKNSEDLRERVHAVAIEPPAQSWDLIAQSLTSFKSSKIRPLVPVKSLGRAAAVIAGVVIVGSLFFLMNGSRKGEIKPEDLTASIPSAKPLLPLAAKITAPRKAALSLLPKISSLYSALGMEKKIEYFNRRELSKAVVRDDDTVEVPEVSIPAKPIRDDAGVVIQNNFPLAEEEGYVSVTGPNGTQTRISSKFAKLLLYLNGDDDTDQQEGVFTKEFLESLLWKSRFQSWKNTISQTAIIPSTTNFLDILEFKDLILEHRDIN